MSPRRPATVPADTAIPRAVVYTRQSVYRDDSLSLESQETICREYCKRRGYDVVAVETDPGESGTKVNRPGFKRVTAHLEHGRATIVVAWKWSRYFRHRLHWNVAVDEIESRGGLLESATEPVDVTTASGRLQRGMLAEFAAFESERTGEVWKETHDRRRRNGLPAQGGDRYGYRRAGRRDEQTFTLDDTEAAVVGWCYGQFIGGAGFAAIARQLNDRGLRNRSGRTWQRTTVRLMLDSGFAAGLIVHHARKDPTYHQGRHPAIIDEATWQAYLSARRRRATVPPRVSQPRYPLTGLIRCGDCGSSMHPTNGGTGTAGHSYVCARWRTTGTGRCVTIVRANAEAAVLEWLAGLAADIDAAAAADRSAKRVQVGARTNAKAAARKVAEVDRQLTELTRQLVAGVVPETAYRSARDELVGERARAAGELERAEHDAGRRPVQSRAIAVSLLEGWDVLPPRDRRDILAELVDRVEVHPPELPGDRRWGRATALVVPIWEVPPP